MTVVYVAIFFVNKSYLIDGRIYHDTLPSYSARFLHIDLSRCVFCSRLNVQAFNFNPKKL